MVDLRSRKDALESKFAHDETLKFKIAARRNKMLGLWAAGYLGKSGADAEAYAHSVVAADLEQPGEDDVVGKILRDFEEAGCRISEREIRETLDSFTVRATEEIKSGT